MRLTLHMFLTIDGVAQAPGGPDEDRDGGFAHGGWSYHYGDEDFGNAVDEWFANADAFLLGRKTYEIFEGYWPKVDDPNNRIATKLNALPKYVASRTLDSARWNNARIIDDVVGEVAKLKEQPGNELQVHGSANLARTLINHDLVDEYRLFFFPVHLGSGKKLFADDVKAGALRHVSTTTTKAGVVIATYQPDAAVRYGSY